MKKSAVFGAILALFLTPSIVLAKPISDFPSINESDWRSADADVPWSEPIIIKDDFDGDYLAVLDRNFSGSVFWAGQESGVVSNWSQRYIRVIAYKVTQSCGLFSCGDNEMVLETKTLDIKVGDKVFKLTGENGNFPVSEELATALRNAPFGEAKIRITLEESGATIDSDIGKDTVKAWKTVYQQATTSTNTTDNEDNADYVRDLLLYGR